MPSYYCTATDVIGRMSERGFQLRLDDRPEAIQQHLREATNRVKLYCMPRYTDAALLADATAGGFVNDLATTLAVCGLSRRRGNTVPSSYREHCEQAEDDLQMIRRDALSLPDVPLRHTGSPAFSNIRITPHVYRRVRVEAPISETTSRTGYTPVVDWLSFAFFEY